MKILKLLFKDERGGHGPVAIKGLVLIFFLMLLMFVLIDFFYISNVYAYVKNQQDLANRAVYAEIDPLRLADREIFINETFGRAKFEEYLDKNLMLNASNIPGRNMRIVGAVRVKDFQIYNQTELPAVTPKGKTVNLVAVYSEIEVEIQPFLFGKFGNITINPHLTTDIPDILLRTFHP